MVLAACSKCQYSRNGKETSHRHRHAEWLFRGRNPSATDGLRSGLDIQLWVNACDLQRGRSKCKLIVEVYQSSGRREYEYESVMSLGMPPKSFSYRPVPTWGSMTSTASTVPAVCSQSISEVWGTPKPKAYRDFRAPWASATQISRPRSSLYCCVGIFCSSGQGSLTPSHHADQISQLRRARRNAEGPSLPATSRSRAVSEGNSKYLVMYLKRRTLITAAVSEPGTNPPCVTHTRNYPCWEIHALMKLSISCARPVAQHRSRLCMLAST
jgi:hypothetical protein